MSRNLVPLARSSIQVDETVISIDWDRLLKRRKSLLKHTDLPPYLLMPEVHELLRFAKHANHHLMFSTLWRTGARISEVLALTPNDFHINGIFDSYVSIKSLKKGRPKKGKKHLPRLVPIADAGYLMELESYITTFSLKKHDKFFTIKRNSAGNRMQSLLKKADKGGLKINIPVSLHTFRHSFAINCILHRVDAMVLKEWLGHRFASTTEKYLQLLTSDTTHLMQAVRF